MKRKIDINSDFSNMMRKVESGEFNYHDYMFSPEENTSILNESIGALRWIADECSKSIENPQTEQKKKVMASKIVSLCNVGIAKGLKWISCYYH